LVNGQIRNILAVYYVRLLNMIMNEWEEMRVEENSAAAGRLKFTGQL